MIFRLYSEIFVEIHALFLDILHFEFVTLFVKHPVEHAMHALTASRQDATSQRTGPRRAVKCYGCGMEGHIRRNCPGQNPVSGGARNSNESSGHAQRNNMSTGRLVSGQSPAPFCLCCGQQGHWMLGCQFLAANGVGMQSGMGENRPSEN